MAYVPLHQDIWLLYAGGSGWALENVDFDNREEWKDGCAASVGSEAITQSPSAGCGRVDIRVILLAMFPFVSLIVNETGPYIGRADGPATLSR